MTLLPFKSKAAAATKTKVIGTPVTGELELPWYGCLTVDEDIVWESELMRLREATMAVAKLEIVTSLLRVRLNLPELTKEKVSEEIGSSTLLEAVYSFFVGERRNWAPSAQILKAEGDDALEVCKQVAKKKKAVVASREDLEAIGTYLVLESEEIALESGYRVLADFSEGTAKNGGKSAA